MAAWLALLAALAAILLSLVLRLQGCRRRIDQQQLKASPLSLAIGDLLSSAGGIYLALVLLAAFLKIPVPDSMLILGISTDPLALSALLLAMVQPLVLQLWPVLSNNTVK